MVGTSSLVNRGYTARFLWLGMFTIELFRVLNMSGLKLILQKIFEFQQETSIPLVDVLYLFPVQQVPRNTLTLSAQLGKYVSQQANLQEFILL